MTLLNILDGFRINLVFRINKRSFSENLIFCACRQIITPILCDAQLELNHISQLWRIVFKFDIGYKI